MFVANSIESGIARATIKPGPPTAQQNQQHDDDQDAPFEQIVHDGVQRAADQVGAVVEDFELDIRRQRRLDLGQPLFDPMHTVRQFSPSSIMTMPVTISPRPSRVTAPWRVSGAMTTLSQVTDQNRQIATLGSDDDLLDVV